MKISLIITTKNETRTIGTLLDSIANQTRIPDELVIADAGSDLRDVVAKYAMRLHIHVIQLHSSANRAVGRNRAIVAASHNHILITDAGCTLKEDWIEQMTTGFARAEVVAGYYQGTYQNVFEACEIPYALVMPDRFDVSNFLPATRSMGITKAAWEKVGRFDEDLRYAEDYAFARKIKVLKLAIAVVPEAIVYWRPRKNLIKFTQMIYEHAYGDGYSKTFRPKVATIYLRYLLIVSFGLWHWPYGAVLVFIYVLYAIQKNYRYINDPQALGYLPLLQVISDFAVMWGTVVGMLKA